MTRPTKRHLKNGIHETVDLDRNASSKNGLNKIFALLARRNYFVVIGGSLLIGGILFISLYLALYEFLPNRPHNSQVHNVHKRSQFLQERASHVYETFNNSALLKIASLSDENIFRNGLLKPFLVERISGTDGNKKVQQHIKDHMDSYGWMIKQDSFIDKTPFGYRNFTNIIATQSPHAPHKLVFACHYDSKNFTDSFEFLAATDSAVPCAMMLDVARSLNDSIWGTGEKEISLQMIFFDGEEAQKDWTKTDSLYGSRHLATKLKTMPSHIKNAGESFTMTELDTIDLLILLDLIGMKEPTFWDWYPKLSSRAFTRLRNIETRLGKLGQIKRSSGKYFSGRNPPMGEIADDHLPFLENNVPVMHLIAYPFPSVWHTAKDDESCLHFDTINDLNVILRVFISEYLHHSS